MILRGQRTITVVERNRIQLIDLEISPIWSYSFMLFNEPTVFSFYANDNDPLLAFRNPWLCYASKLLESITATGFA